MTNGLTLARGSHLGHRYLTRALMAGVAVTVLPALSLACGGGNDEPKSANEEPSPIIGIWDTSEWERQSGETLEHIPEELRPERWTISGPDDCTDESCVYDLTTEPLGRAGGQFDTELRLAEEGTYVAEIEFVSACTDRATGEVREPNASAVTSKYEVRVQGEPDALELAITAVWEGEPTQEGIAAGCNIKAARYEATAQPANPDAPASEGAGPAERSGRGVLGRMQGSSLRPQV